MSCLSPRVEFKPSGLSRGLDQESGVPDPRLSRMGAFDEWRVSRLGTFTQNSYTSARAYEPYWKDGRRYVEFNTKYLAGLTDAEIAGTTVHEIGHSLGIGWDEWHDLFDGGTGLFTPEAVGELGDLEQMEVELTGGPGTAYSHWDEDKFDKALMTASRTRVSMCSR